MLEWMKKFFNTSSEGSSCCGPNSSFSCCGEPAKADKEVKPTEEKK